MNQLAVPTAEQIPLSLMTNMDCQVDDAVQKGISSIHALVVAVRIWRVIQLVVVESVTTVERHLIETKGRVAW